ncbi:MAG: PBP1A family penicillin-binding protein, partial [Alphaproteobacteria bacterium]|nr:PBP1A family penicillin-binding protein [Alphaproteobacteria bacterium]
MITSLFEYSSMLPDYRQLAKYEPKVTTRLYAGDGQLLMEYASEKRFFVPIDKIPERVKQAFIAAEDKNFYNHSGLDYQGIVRAALGNIIGMFSGKRPSGASTITQQVAKNFLLTPEVSYKRKIKEALLAFRIEDAFSKDHILELYLNEIYLGNRSYGVASAALNYFGKSLDELTIEEVAYLAALPKGPNNYHPQKHTERAVSRRNWVIDRMLEEGYITAEEAVAAKEKALDTIDRTNEFVKNAQYFSEEVRRHVTKDFGEDALYEGGLIIRTTVDPKLQDIAAKSFRKQLLAYDKRHGWRGAPANIELKDKWQDKFAEIELPKGAEKTWHKAIVTDISEKIADIYISDTEKGQIHLSSLDWARKPLKDQAVGAAPKNIAEVLHKGDVIYVEASKNKGEYELRQVPNVEGGMVVMDPHTGKVLALVGGFDFSRSQFNRATQALRQTGSAFKPFVYMAALDNGYSPTDLILDAPFVLDQGEGLPKWKPKNYSTNFYGLTTLRQGIEKSRNLMTVRLAQDIGMKKVSEYAAKFGINDNLPELLSMSLGAGETHLIDMATGYSMIVNGGKRVVPYFVEMIQDRNGKAIYQHNNSKCTDCNYLTWQNQNIPQLSDTREQIVDPLSAYQI